ncbi:zona pellucida sperm-binding protein 4-like [Myxocyprinus asiaticus]|uniref:zona pellucida sperm-binding protein 4-like n=1 Tax=Myxocyprinus asiaticus TaxID=70543 RepID=UPI0022225D47|nr:zona pellucida sperm-binding protein 4-like [Myxocyprinus asiaticus]
MTDALEDHHGTVSIEGRTITNLRFADDIDGLAGSKEELANLVNLLDKKSTRYGMEKTKIMTNSTQPITKNILVNGQKLEEVHQFKYLGAIISEEGSRPEILDRAALTTAVLAKLKPIWRDSKISLKSKLKLLHALVMSIFLYACETWTLTAELERKIKTVEMRCYRRILGISYMDHITNEEVQRRIKAQGHYEDLLAIVKRRKMRCGVICPRFLKRQSSSKVNNKEGFQPGVVKLLRSCQALQPQTQFSQAFPPKQPVAQAEPLDKCAVTDYEQIQCGQPGISAAECDAINCCFNGQQCYYGKAVTVQCIRDGQFVVVVARDVTLPSLSLDTVRLLGGNDPPCAPVGSTPTFAIYQFPVTACGTSMMEDNGYVVYENRMTSSYEVGIGPLGSITRDSHFELLFQCRYSGTAVQALVVEVNTVPPPPPVAAPGPLRVELRLANGQCVTKGCAEEDAAYTSYYSDADYPVTRVLRQPVYVEVHLLERTDPNIVLMLGHCWATSTPDPLSLPRWDLLVNGCPYQDDRYLTTLVPVDGSSGLQFPTHYKRFIVKMFTFVDPASLAPLQGMVFIHCSTSVCHPSPSGSCEQSCFRQKRGVVETVEKAVVSSGGIFLYVN